MPNLKSAVHNLINIDLINECDFNNKEMLNTITNNILDNVGNIINQVFNLGTLSLENFDKEPIFTKVFIDGESVESLLENITEPMDDIKRGNLGYLMVARAQLYGQEVMVVPGMSSDINDGVIINSAFKNVTMEKLNGWEKFWSQYGFFAEKAFRIEKRQKLHALLHENLDAREENNFKITAQQRAAVVDANIKTAEALFPKYTKFRNIALDNQKAILTECFSETEPSAFPKLSDGTPGNYNNLSGNYNFRGRAMFSMVMCIMLRDGFSIKDACSLNGDEKVHAARIKAAKELLELHNAIDNKNLEISMPARQKLTDLYEIGAAQLIKEKVPSEEELDGFLDSKDPFYLFTISHLGFDISQELEVSKKHGTAAISTPEQQNQLDLMSHVSLVGKFSNIHNATEIQIVEYKNNPNISTEENREKKIECYSRYMGMLTAHSVAKELSVHTGSSLGDYALANQSNFPKYAAYAASSLAICANYFTAVYDDPKSLDDVISGKLSMFKIVEQTSGYIDCFETKQNRIKSNGGTLEQISARGELAYSMVDILDERRDSGKPKFTKQQKAKLAFEMLQNPTFKEMTDYEPDKILKLKKDFNFYKSFMLKFEAKMDKASTTATVKKEPKTVKENSTEKGL